MYPAITKHTYNRLPYNPQDLVRRLLWGPEYCTYEEYEAYNWLCQMFSIPIFEPNVPCQASYMLAQRAEFENKYWGGWTIEVPIDNQNPWRPQIVNEIMNQIGMELVHYSTWNQSCGIEETVPVAVNFTYKY